MAGAAARQLMLERTAFGGDQRGPAGLDQGRCDLDRAALHAAGLQRGST